MKKKLICGFILLVLIILPINLLAVTINGFIFDENSANLTNQWFPMSVGQSFSMKCINSGQIGAITPTGPETIYGVKCIKWTGGSHDWWLAQDINGNIHVFKHNTDEVNSDDDIPNFFLPVDPVATGTWSWKMDSFGPVYYEVLSNSTTVGDESIAIYTNCLKISEGTTGDHWQNMYLKNGIGFVAHEETEELCIRLQNNGDTVDVSGEWFLYTREDGENWPEKPIRVGIVQTGNSLFFTVYHESGTTENVTGTIYGSQISFTSTDPSGGLVTSSIGIVSIDTMSGTWTDTMGRSGTWKAERKLDQEKKSMPWIPSLLLDE